MFEGLSRLKILLIHGNKFQKFVDEVVSINLLVTIIHAENSIECCQLRDVSIVALMIVLFLISLIGLLLNVCLAILVLFNWYVSTEPNSICCYLERCCNHSIIRSIKSFHTQL